MKFTCIPTQPSSNVSIEQDENDVDILVGGVLVAWFCGETSRLTLAQLSSSDSKILTGLGVEHIPGKGESRHINIRIYEGCN